VPINPIITPIIWDLLKVNPNAKAPRISVFNGVNELSIELTELVIWVCAKANKNAGIKVPKNEVNTMYFHWCLLISVRLLNPISIRKTAENKIRNDPSCIGESPTKPRFIKINELPQIKERTINNTHFMFFKTIFKKNYDKFIPKHFKKIITLFQLISIIKILKIMTVLKSIVLTTLLSTTLIGCKDTASKPAKEVSAVKKEMSVAKNPQKATFQIEGMSCAVGCAKTIEEDISKMDGVQKSSVDFDKKTAIIEFDADKIKAEDLVKKAEAAADGVTYKVSNLVVTK